MKKGAFILTAFVAFAIVLAAGDFSAMADDYQLWNDVYTSTQSWSNWPATLAVILVEFPDVTHEGYYDGAGVWRPFDEVYT